MSLRVSTRALCAGLGLLLVSGSARAGFSNFNECFNPLTIPVTVYNTIVNQSFQFGALSQKVCNSITKKGVALCKSQVKLASKCNDKTAKSDYVIQVKQCNQIADSGDRTACKTGSKGDLDFIKSTNKSNESDAVAECRGEFEAALQDACMNGVPM